MRCGIECTEVVPESVEFPSRVFVCGVLMTVESLLQRSFTTSPIYTAEWMSLETQPPPTSRAALRMVAFSGRMTASVWAAHSTNTSQPTSSGVSRRSKMSSHRTLQDSLALVSVYTVLVLITSELGQHRTEGGVTPRSVTRVIKRYHLLLALPSWVDKCQRITKRAGALATVMMTQWRTEKISFESACCGWVPTQILEASYAMCSSSKRVVPVALDIGHFVELVVQAR